MLPYAAYLRVYEPLSAFGQAEGRHWSAYAASAERPRRAGALAAEQGDALRRLIALPPVAAPQRESRHAYVRWSEGVTYVCPWQTRLRAWLALARLRLTAPALAQAAFPAGGADAAVGDFARWQGGDPSLRVYIQASTWAVPFAWFVPFAADERWLVLGTPGDPGEGGRATAAGTRTLVYATAMAAARQRVARALAMAGGGQARGGSAAGGAAAGGGRSRGPAAPGGPGAPAVTAAIAEVGRWLEEFHPHAVVELDYGGLVYLLDDAALCADQSVAEVSAAIGALAAGESELATAMYQRFAARWQAMQALERGS